MSVVLIDEKIVHYEVLGRGRPILFLHGWVGSWRYWVPAMQAAAMSFRAYAIDLWGFGDSAKEAEDYSLQKQTDLVESFLRTLGIGKIALIGHGLGAIVASLFARQFPDAVDRLMLISVPFEIRAVSPRLRNPVSPSDLAEWLTSREPVADPVRQDAPKTDVQAIVTSLNGLDAMSLLPMMDTYLTPCLVVHGEMDPAVAMTAYERILAMPETVHQIVLEHSGHFPMLDESSKFNRLLFDFLSLDSGESPRELQLKEEWKRRVR
ncbi:MAG: alpha/beta hydrolase [Anaerolineales bacterium]|nr:alpha/beta hydrolase [Anaerolineales bacterium]MCX7607819.1 alpha/beta hydrolase [Anaerolineales bacterium]MDW8227295.1 alpha/beta hydrolase [Anaerolineales bacterium]